jgi:outer membrane protein
MKINKKYLYTIMLIASISLPSMVLHAQNKTPYRSLRDLLQIAEINYPVLKSKRLDEQAAQKNVNVSKNLLVPSLEASYQINYATYNNITGMVYPQYIIPISGPPSKSNDLNGVFGSATSLLLNWQPITFGQRKGQVNYARAGSDYADADVRNEVFQHKIKVINAYLDALTAEELTKVYLNNLKRTETSLEEIYSLVTSGIKPGVDTSLFKAEVSKAKVELLNNRKYREQAHIYLSQLLASDTVYSFTDTLFYFKLPVNFLIQYDSVRHPLMTMYKTNYEISIARKKVLSRTMLPALGVWGTTYARGSGISYNGTVNSSDGLGLQRVNYGIGVQLSLPVLQYARIRPQLQQQDLLIQSNQEKLNEIELQLKEETKLAEVTINNAYAVAKESILFLQSAQYSFDAMQSRYKSGLATFADLMQVQYALVKAETDYKLSFMEVWKALLFKASVSGNLDLFINQVN